MQRVHSVEAVRKTNSLQDSVFHPQRPIGGRAAQATYDRRLAEGHRLRHDFAGVPTHAHRAAAVATGAEIGRVPTELGRTGARELPLPRASAPQRMIDEPTLGKSERGPGDQATPTHGPGKKGEAGTGALIGGGIGAAAGAVIGLLLGGPLGALAGAGIGALAGALIGALVGRAGAGIKWQPEGYSAVAAGGSSTTIERPFTVRYKAVMDKAKGVWHLVVDSIEGGVDIEVHTGGSRDPFVSPPTNQAEANDAVTDMKGYYARGGRGAWHTEAASRAHEEHHFREWRCSSEHYWPLAKHAIESLTAPVAANPNEAAAVATMRAGAAGADAKLQAFQKVARDYWFTLADNAGARPYAAGQHVLNQAVTHVQTLAGSKGWAVPSGVSNPSAEPPCYQPWLAYAP